MCTTAAVRCSVFRSAAALANTFLTSERKDKKKKGKGKGKEAGQHERHEEAEGGQGFPISIAV